MKIRFLLSACCLPLLLVASTAQAQVTPRPVPSNATKPAQKLFPRQTDLFGITIQVSEAGFAPLSRLSNVRDSSPHFFVRWNVSTLPKNAQVRFLGLVKPENKNGKYADFVASTEIFPTTPAGDSTSVLDEVLPSPEKLLACWEVSDPNRTAEDNGTFLKTYDFTSEVPTREKKVIRPENSLTTAHDTKITLQRVECDYNGAVPVTRATFQITRGKTIIPDNLRPELYTSGALLNISDDTGKVLKPTTLNPDSFMQALSQSTPMTFSVEGAPTEGAKELHLQFSMSESSTEFRNKDSFKRAFVEVPVAALAAKSNFKPTPAELSPTTTFEDGGLSARLDSKYESDLWKGTVWVRSNFKAAPVDGMEVSSSYNFSNVVVTTAEGVPLRTEGTSGFRPTGHNDGTFADESELSCRIDLPRQQTPQKGTVSIDLNRIDFKSYPLSFEYPPLMQAGIITTQPPVTGTPTNTWTQNVAPPSKIAILDADLKALLVKNSGILALNLPLGSLVIVTPIPPKGIPSFTLRSVESGTQKMNANIALVFDGDYLVGNKPGPFRTLIYSTASPISLTQGLVLNGEVGQKLNSQTITLTFKGVPLKP